MSKKFTYKNFGFIVIKCEQSLLSLQQNKTNIRRSKTTFLQYEIPEGLELELRLRLFAVLPDVNSLKHGAYCKSKKSFPVAVLRLRLP